MPSSRRAASTSIAARCGSRSRSGNWARTWSRSRCRTGSRHRSRPWSSKRSDGMTVTPTGGAVPPQNIEAEESVLGAMLLAEPAIASVMIDVRLEPDDFYRDSHRAIFEAIRRLTDKSDGIDPLRVCAELERGGRREAAGGRAYVYQPASGVPSAGTARHYARIVKEEALMRRLLTFS